MRPPPPDPTRPITTGWTTRRRPMAMPARCSGEGDQLPHLADTTALATGTPALPQSLRGVRSHFAGSVIVNGGIDPADAARLVADRPKATPTIPACRIADGPAVTWGGQARMRNMARRMTASGRASTVEQPPGRRCRLASYPWCSAPGAEVGRSPPFGHWQGGSRAGGCRPNLWPSADPLFWRTALTNESRVRCHVDWNFAGVPIEGSALFRTCRLAPVGGSWANSTIHASSEPNPAKGG